MSEHQGLSGRVVSLQVGRAGTLRWRGQAVHSAIAKHRVDGARVALGTEGFDGDEQADRRLHGGPDKAVCCYPSEHLPAWSSLLGRDLAPGAFGENLSLAGLTEDRVHIGDTYSLGTALVAVSQPRGPCFKVAARWGARTLPKEMAQGLQSGFYLRVLEPGAVAAGDTMTLVQRISDVSVAEVLRVTYRDRRDPPALRAVMDVPELAEEWRVGLTRLAELNRLPLADPVGDD